MNKVTGRKEHLRANRDIATGLWFGCIVIFVSLIFILIYEKRLDLIQIWWLLALPLTPVMFRNHEKWATPDVDMPTRGGFMGAYWKLYAKKVRHRGVLSHSLLVGSGVRFCIAYCVPLAATVALFNIDVIQMLLVSDRTLYIDLIQMFTLPEQVCWFIAWWFGICCLSDLTHYLVDDIFWPHKLLLLGDP